METQLLPRVELLRRQELGSRSSKAEVKAEVDHSEVSDMVVHRKDSEEGRNFVGHVEALPHKKESAPSVMSHIDQNMESEEDKNLEELGFVPSAVSEPRWALHIFDKKY